MRLYLASIVDPSQLKPRVKMGLRLYVHCACPTIKSAARAVGINPTYLTLMSKTVGAQKFMDSAHAIMAETATSTSALIEKLSRRAIGVIATTMEDASSEALRLKAAIDLADRGSETSKIQKHQVESFTMDSKDARSIAEAMVSAALVRGAHSNLITENFDRVNVLSAEESLPIMIPPASLRLEP